MKIYFLAFLFLLFIVFSTSCKKEESPPVTNGPSCSIEYPTEGYTITQGDSVLISVGISEGDHPVNELTISIDNKEVITHVDSPYVYLWITHGLSIGEHKVDCEVIDEAGFLAKDEIMVHIKESMFLIDPRDGQVYKTVVIGGYKWMAENLNYTSPFDFYSYGWLEGYGKYYRWEDALNVCPTGWHLPTDNEWKMLELSLGMDADEIDLTQFRGDGIGDMLKDTSWYGSTEEYNSSGFSALASGYYHIFQGWHYEEHLSTAWWTSTSVDSTQVYSRWLDFDESGVGRYSYIWNYAMGVRCIQD